MLRCLTPYVARRCYRESSISRVRPKRARILRREALGYPPSQDQTPCCLVRATGTFDPGRLQPARAQPCGRASQATFTLRSRCLAITPFCSAGPNPSSSGWELPRRTTLLSFGKPCGTPEQSGKDVSCQPLQPIYDTSTHRPFDSRANDFRRADRTSPRHMFGATARRSASLRRQDPRWTRA
jgi:hypothetical protein